eukprot:403355365
MADKLIETFSDSHVNQMRSSSEVDHHDNSDIQVQDKNGIDQGLKKFLSHKKNKSHLQSIESDTIHKLTFTGEKDDEFHSFKQSTNHSYNALQKSEKFHDLKKFIEVQQQVKTESNQIQDISKLAQNAQKINDNQKLSEIIENPQQINQSAQEPQAMQNQDVFSKLYLENVKKRENLRKNQLQKSQYELKGCTFRPQTNSQRRLSISSSNQNILKDSSILFSNKKNIGNIDSSPIQQFQTEQQTQNLRQLNTIESTQQISQISGQKENKSSTSRHEKLYQSQKERNEKLTQKKQQIEQERLKDCSFKPQRETKKYEQKMGILQNLDSLERVYKFQVDSVLKKYQNMDQTQKSLSHSQSTYTNMNQQQNPKGVSQQSILITNEQKIQQQKFKDIKNQIHQNKSQKSELSKERMSKLLNELYSQQKQESKTQTTIRNEQINSQNQSLSRSKSPNKLKLPQPHLQVTRDKSSPQHSLRRNPDQVVQSDEVLFQQMYLKKNYDSNNLTNSQSNFRSNSNHTRSQAIANGLNKNYQQLSALQIAQQNQLISQRQRQNSVSTRELQSNIHNKKDSVRSGSLNESFQRLNKIRSMYLQNPKSQSKDKHAGRSNSKSFINQSINISKNQSSNINIQDMSRVRDEGLFVNQHFNGNKSSDYDQAENVSDSVYTQSQSSSQQINLN